MIDPELLMSFVTVCETGGFTSAARQLGLSQSTISQHIRRLEDHIGKTLLQRSTHSVMASLDGDAILDLARAILEAHDRLDRHVQGTQLRGRIRFGACEDFVMSALPEVLAQFAHDNPNVDVEMTVALSETLYERYDRGVLDIIFVKRRAGDDRGHFAWRENLAWLVSPDFEYQPGETFPLLVYPPPSVSRRLAIATLEMASREWRIAFTSGSLTGLTAAVKAGVGLMPHSGKLLPPGCSIMPAAPGIPELPSMEFVVLEAGKSNPVVSSLSATILSVAAQPGRFGLALQPLQIDPTS
jgi:DNA-binding transcriptional LysR family regulator